jgi:sacsin
MAQHKDSISPAVFSQLRQTRFLVVLDGSLQAPENVVDPQSVIAPLFLPNDNRFPSVTDKTALIECLQLLKIMQNTVTADIVRERIQFISLAAGTTPEKVTGLSRKLLRLLHSSSFDCADLKINQNLKWLPTQEGLLHPAGCHDEHSHQKELFDQVLPLVAPSIRISSSLRDALGWSQPLPIRVLANQLSKALNLRPDEAHKRIEILIKELSQPERELVDKDFKRLHAAIANRPWVPVSGGRLVNTSHAVFSDTKAGFQAGFHEIPFIQIHQRKFLLRMGCSEEYGYLAFSNL